MSANKISVKIENNGSIFWDRYTPDNLNPVICPQRDKPCHIFCPLLMIEEDGEHLLFSCGTMNMRYTIESLTKTEADHG